jgi:hypothetical protein
MPKQPEPLCSNELPQSQPATPEMTIKDPPEQPDLKSVAERVPTEPLPGEPARQAVGRQNAKHSIDRYDVIGAAIVLLIVAVWVVHFLLPAAPPVSTSIGGPP